MTQLIEPRGCCGHDDVIIGPKIRGDHEKWIAPMNFPCAKKTHLQVFTDFGDMSNFMAENGKIENVYFALWNNVYFALCILQTSNYKHTKLIENNKQNGGNENDGILRQITLI